MIAADDAPFASFDKAMKPGAGRAPGPDAEEFAGRRPDDSVDTKIVGLLERSHRRLRLLAEHAVAGELFSAGVDLVEAVLAGTGPAVRCRRDEVFDRSDTTLQR